MKYIYIGILNMLIITNILSLLSISKEYQFLYELQLDVQVLHIVHIDVQTSLTSCLHVPGAGPPCVGGGVGFGDYFVPGPEKDTWQAWSCGW